MTRPGGRRRWPRLVSSRFSTPVLYRVCRPHFAPEWRGGPASRLGSGGGGVVVSQPAR